jgi:hypothetical protein
MMWINFNRILIDSLSIDYQKSLVAFFWDDEKENKTSSENSKGKFEVVKIEKQIYWLVELKYKFNKICKNKIFITTVMCD